MITHVASARMKSFRAAVQKNYRFCGRHHLPWRETDDPYKILVSELMLQQTQVARVLPKYAEFIKLFPNFRALAQADLSAVLRAWQGLGYNRRAKFLRELAQVVVTMHRGKLPASELALLALPGVGKATAAAVRAFAFDSPADYVETNVRTVFLHHFFKNRTAVSDAELLPLVRVAAAGQDPRVWNWALLDYGVHIKERFGNASVRSKHYVKQSQFQGSLRQLRGRLLKLLQNGPYSVYGFQVETGESKERISEALQGLVRDGLVSVRARKVWLGA